MDLDALVAQLKTELQSYADMKTEIKATIAKINALLSDLSNAL